MIGAQSSVFMLPLSARPPLSHSPTRSAAFYCHKYQQQAANPHISEAGSGELTVFGWKSKEMINWSAKHDKRVVFFATKRLISQLSECFFSFCHQTVKRTQISQISSVVKTFFSCLRMIQQALKSHRLLRYMRSSVVILTPPRPFYVLVAWLKRGGGDVRVPLHCTRVPVSSRQRLMGRM